MNDNNDKKSIKFIREICKAKTEEELLEAEENFREYLLIVKGICDRLEDKDETVGFDELESLY